MFVTRVNTDLAVNLNETGRITENYRKLQIYVIKCPDFFSRNSRFISFLGFTTISFCLGVLIDGLGPTPYAGVTLQPIPGSFRSSSKKGVIGGISSLSGRGGGGSKIASKVPKNVAKVPC